MSPFFTLDTNKACTVFLLADILCNTNKTNKSKTLWSALRLTPSMTWGERKYDINLKLSLKNDYYRLLVLLTIIIKDIKSSFI